MKKATIQLEVLSCPSCLQKIDRAVKAVEGVEKESVNVLFNSSKLKVNFDEAVTSVEKIEEAITSIGFDVLNTQVQE